MNTCPCGTGLDYSECCKKYIDGAVAAPTAETLMRSRYSAFAKNRIEYLTASLHPTKRATHNEQETRDWASKSEWLGLKIVETRDGTPEDQTGTVEFIASYKTEDQDVEHHEVAEFRKKDDEWFFYDGKVRGGDPIVNEDPKVGRNDPCPCGSGKKFKKCCANK